MPSLTDYIAAAPLPSSFNSPRLVCHENSHNVCCPDLWARVCVCVCVCIGSPPILGEMAWTAITDGLHSCRFPSLQLQLTEAGVPREFTQRVLS